MWMAVASTPITPHQAINEEEINSIASSPSSSQGPLSPKTPTTMKSTSQVSAHHLEIRQYIFIKIEVVELHARVDINMREVRRCSGFSIILLILMAKCPRKSCCFFPSSLVVYLVLINLM